MKTADSIPLKRDVTFATLNALIPAIWFSVPLRVTAHNILFERIRGVSLHTNDKGERMIILSLSEIETQENK